MLAKVKDAYGSIGIFIITLLLTLKKFFGILADFQDILKRDTLPFCTYIIEFTSINT